MKLPPFSWKPVSAYALAAFFSIGSVANFFAPEAVVADYLRWGYPHWFHYVTGLLEAIVAVLLVRAAWRFSGALLGTFVMLSAALTVLVNREYAHAAAPIAVFAVSACTAWLHRPSASRQ